MRRVVVTGLGTINPLGNTVKNSWEALVGSKSGISKINKFDVDEYPCKIAASIDDTLIDNDIVTTRDQRKIDRFIALGLIAAHEAVMDSGFESDSDSSYRSGVMVGSGIGGLDTIYRNSSVLDNQGIRKISPFLDSVSAHILNEECTVRTVPFTLCRKSPWPAAPPFSVDDQRAEVFFHFCTVFSVETEI